MDAGLGVLECPALSQGDVRRRPGVTGASHSTPLTADLGFDQKLRRATLDWIGPMLSRDRYLAQTLTFKPCAGRLVSRTGAIETLDEFLKRLQRKALGREYSRRGAYLQRVPVLEGGSGSFDKHRHLHLLTEIPSHFQVDDFAELSRSCWKQLAMASPRENRHEFCYDERGWLGYLLKVRDKPLYADALIIEHLRL